MASVNLDRLRATLREGREDGYLPKEMAYVPDVGVGSNLYFANPNRVEFDRGKPKNFEKNPEFFYKS